MLKRNPEQRATLSEILQDSELRNAWENPLDGTVITVAGERLVVVPFMLLFSFPLFTGHWSDIYEKMT